MFSWLSCIDRLLFHFIWKILALIFKLMMLPGNSFASILIDQNWWCHALLLTYLKVSDLHSDIHALFDLICSHYRLNHGLVNAHHRIEQFQRHLMHICRPNIKHWFFYTLFTHVLTSLFYWRSLLCLLNVHVFFESERYYLICTYWFFFNAWETSFCGSLSRIELYVLYTAFEDCCWFFWCLCNLSCICAYSYSFAIRSILLIMIKCRVWGYKLRLLLIRRDLTVHHIFIVWISFIWIMS